MADKHPSKAKSDREGKAKPPDQTGQCAQEDANNVEVGMEVEADKGDLGQGDSPRKVIISASEGEIEALAPAGPQPLPPADMTGSKHGEPSLDEEARPGTDQSKRRGIFKVLGPSLLSGMAGNDASANRRQ
jgi:hypothetical protein